MYCKFCGKELSEGARFCGFCGKDQESNGFIPTEKDSDNRKVIPEFEIPNSKLFTILSLLIEAVIIGLSFTPLLSMSLGNDYIGYNQSFNIFDLFKQSNILDYVAYMLKNEFSRNASDSIKGVCVFLGVVLCALIVWCICYYLYNITTYTLKSGQTTKFHFGYVYSVYSSVPPIFLSIGIIILNILFSSWFSNYVDVTISPTSIIICILSIGQFIINRIYLTN